MPRYLAFVMTLDGTVIDRIPFDCADDETAIERAKVLAPSYPVELWESETPRRIGRFDPKNSI